jgi:hypothetical protein
MAKKRNWTIAAFVPASGENKALDDWFARLRTAAIARIVEAVGKSIDDEAQLATDIFEACITTRLKLDLSEGSKAAQRLQKVQSIRREVERQTALISADTYLSKAIGDPAGVKPLVNILELRDALRGLEIQLSVLAKRWRSKTDLPPELKGRRPSGPEWLAGVALPLVYERHFLSPAGRSRNARGEPGGPTVRFVDATLKELGIRYSPESIVRAFTGLWRQRDEERKRSGVSRRAKIG